MTEKITIDYKDTVFLPKTDFPMKAGLPQKEPGILAKWEAMGLYHRLREAREGREKFILHDGPPYANGDMHIGHALNHILKDMVCRTQSLLGKDAPYVPGWDCHGLPIEWKVEEQYRKKKLNKDEVPVKEFRAECRAYAQHWVNVQREQVKRLGVLGHWEKPYLTMDFDSEATIVAELLKFAESGQLYRGAKPVMWSPVEKTALAEAEIEYEDIVSTQIDVAFEIMESPIPELVGAHAVIWTTTPWTIPVNQAIAYGPDVDYVLTGFVARAVGAPAMDKQAWIRATEAFMFEAEDRFLISKDLLPSVLRRLNQAVSGIDVSDLGAERIEIELIAPWKWVGPQGNMKIVPIRNNFKGSDLAGTIARHPMHHLGGFFAKPRPFLPGDFVTTDSGTGLVHMAPDHGEDDFDLCKANGIEPQFAVEGDGKYRADWAWLGGSDERQGSVINPKFNAPDGPICSDLREAGGLLAASADYQHSYPHSWRSKAKVIYRCTPQWFVPMDKPVEQNRSAELVEARLSDESRPSTSSGLRSLREAAVQAIADTRWIPEKGRNRISSMVEGRPDWVLSRQRAWGVPITLFVDRKTGQYLNDPAVNARIVEAIKAEGVDAWEAARAQEYLGDAYRADDYEQVTDILDVWFDSGCTHVFTLESGKWPELSWPANLYLEGSDQHRGWFQSSLLQSCGTRGRAPYDQVLTHGFTMDQKGMKMSKSLGNTIDPLKIMENSGADIIRLWALSVDFTEDHRIGDEILKGVGDQYRKLRNTFRYMLGALDGFSDAERLNFGQGLSPHGDCPQSAPEEGTVPMRGQSLEELPELERYVLHLLADMDAKLKVAVEDYDFNSYVRLLTDFANEDLSAFFFDIRKDCLYCDVNPASGYQSDKRRAYRTVLDILFNAMVRYAAPVLVFTAEEVWSTRFPDAGSVHLLEWPELPIVTGTRMENVASGGVKLDLITQWSVIRNTRALATEHIEPMRREKVIGSSLEAEVWMPFDKGDFDFEEILISAAVHKGDWKVTKTTNHKCGRCWRHLPEVSEDGALCGRCEDVLNN
jgi:isoleucyl-tRNA synthetase